MAANVVGQPFDRLFCTEKSVGDGLTSAKESGPTFNRQQQHDNKKKDDPVASIIVGSLFVILTHITWVPEIFRKIFVGAFNPQAVFGGVVGVMIKDAVSKGIARGLFSNEAGMGSTPHAHAVAKVDHPSHQGYVAMIGVFIGTLIILDLTAFV